MLLFGCVLIKNVGVIKTVKWNENWTQTFQNEKKTITLNNKQSLFNIVL